MPLELELRAQFGALAATECPGSLKPSLRVFESALRAVPRLGERELLLFEEPSLEQPFRAEVRALDLRSRFMARP